MLADCPVATEETHLGQIRTYTIADTYARFLRARGRAVLFSLGFDSFGPPVELQASRLGISPRDWVERCYERTRGRLEELGCSCDWERAFISSEPECYGWTQWLFLTMLERELVYRRGTQWFMRIDLHIEENERGLTTLTGWNETAIELQRATIGRVEGVEMRASTFGGADLTVFTPHPEAIAKATFVAISPAHPDIDQSISDPALAEQIADMRAGEWRAGDDARELPIIITEVLATVPGGAGMLPIVISPLVDVRFGPTAILGIPELDATDSEIAKRLPAPTGTAWKVSSSAPATRPAVRYLAQDLAVSQPRAWGAPIPLVNCPACGTVPVPLDQLPVRLPDDLRFGTEGGNPLADRADFYQCTCPGCGGAALRETGTIDCRMDRMWMWMRTCIPPERRSSAMSDDPEYARWLPVAQVVSDVDEAACIFERRLLAEMLQDIGELPPLADREPFSKALVHQGVRLQAAASRQLGSVGDLDELIAQVGSDTVRLAMLHAASPGRAFSWNEQPLRHCQRFLQRLYGYAEPRLGDWRQRSDRAQEQARIDTSDKLRRRLAHWCAVACEKVTLQLEDLELQRAAHNAMLLLTRIQDFESRVLELRGEIEALDREAIVAALLLLVRLLAPLTPHIAEQLWSVAGNTALVGDAGWPSSQPAAS